MGDLLVLAFITLTYMTVPYLAGVAIVALMAADFLRATAQTVAFHVRALTSGRPDMYNDWHQEELPGE